MLCYAKVITIFAYKLILYIVSLTDSKTVKHEKNILSYRSVVYKYFSFCDSMAKINVEN
jgi:uncharacterized protein (UPF0262 family)